MLVRYYFGFITLLLLSASALGQEKYNKSATFTKTELLQDASYLEEYLIKGHPGLYWHSSEKNFKEAINQLKASLHAGMTALDFLAHAAKLNVFILILDLLPTSIPIGKNSFL